MTHIPEYPVAGLQAVISTMDDHDESKGSAWKEQSVEYHVKHAVDHLLAHLAGSKTEPHLEHAACRTAMAVHIASTTPKRSATNGRTYFQQNAEAGCALAAAGMQGNQREYDG